MYRLFVFLSYCYCKIHFRAKIDSNVREGRKVGSMALEDIARMQVLSEGLQVLLGDLYY
jgi:hypothetical protein